MYCKQCRYPLSHLRTPACPECGRAFDSSDRRTYNRTDRQWRIGVKTWLILLLAIYVGGYGAARWRKLLVRYERHTLGSGDYVYFVKSGVDLRDHGVGAFKNAIAKPVALVFTPLRKLEAAYWNWVNKRDDVA